MNKPKLKINEKGITLVALVITIIVLLILAGVAINMAINSDGLFGKANEATQKWSAAKLQEELAMLELEIELNKHGDNNSTESTAKELENKLNESGSNVVVIAWDKYIIFDLSSNHQYRVNSDGKVEDWGESTLGNVLRNTKTANAEQLEWDSTTSNIIGIDNQGNTVNMLRWKYTLIEDANLGKLGTYGLNDAVALKGSSEGRSAGYLPSYTIGAETISNYNEDGTIKGTVPAYISTDGGKTYVSVTSMKQTFYACEELIIAPEIPNTVIDLGVCFYKSTNLAIAPDKIPDSVIFMGHAFRECALTIAPTIGKNVQSLNSTFMNCKNLIKAPEIPNSVTSLQETFGYCTNLKEAPIVIPNSVTNMFGTFRSCSKLEGTIKIDASLDETIVLESDGYEFKGYSWTFLVACSEGNGLTILKTSTCPKEILVKMVDNNAKITIEE